MYEYMSCVLRGVETNSNLPILTRVQDFEDVWEEPVQLNIGVMYSVQNIIISFIL